MPVCVIQVAREACQALTYCFLNLVNKRPKTVGKDEILSPTEDHQLKLLGTQSKYKFFT